MFRPLAGGVIDAQNDDIGVVDAIGNDIRQARNDKFPCFMDPAGAAQMGCVERCSTDSMIFRTVSTSAVGLSRDMYDSTLNRSLRALLVHLTGTARFPFMLYFIVGDQFA